MSTFLESDAVRVYPASNRTESADKYARANIEHNLINVINRLTGVDSFIVDGLDISGGKIGKGVVNIHGYLFELTTAHTLPSVSSEGSYLCLQIRVGKTDGREQLCNVSDATDLASDSVDSTNTSWFTGLSFEIMTQAEYEALEYPLYALPVAIVKSGVWKPITFDDGVDDNSESKDRAFKQLFTLDQIMVESSLSGNPYVNKKQTLMTFLEKNYIIDDGEID